MNVFRRFLCNILDWHTPDNKASFNGLTFYSKCKHCGRPIALDSQGNWYSVGEPIIDELSKQFGVDLKVEE